MKKAVLVLMLVSASVFAQEIPDPEFTMRPYLLSGTGLASLESPLVQTNPVNATSFIVQDKQAKSRLKKSGLLTFVIKTEPGIDPADKIKLARADVNKDSRVFTQALSDNTKNNLVENLKLEFIKFREGIYIIKLPPGIEAGEYVFVQFPEKGTPNVTCFGID